MIPTSIADSASPFPLSATEVAADVRERVKSGAALKVAGEGKRDPSSMLRKYSPIAKLQLFDHLYYLAKPRQIPELRFFIGYFVPYGAKRARAPIHARVFYKDLSLVWRTASHLIANDDDFWIGKGAVDVRPDFPDELQSFEETCDLPLEIQTALEDLNRAAKNIVNDQRALHLALRNAPQHRIEPYADFNLPRARAQADKKNLINGGRPIARFTRKDVPESLEIVSGYQPDFRHGVIERSASRSTMYHGRVRRFRILSENRKVHYLFFAGPKQIWIVPPQALTTDLSTYGVRTIDVNAPDDMFVPGYEFHYVADDVPVEDRFSQIPEGFAGKPSEYNGDRADASAWLNRLPVVRDFRRQVLKQKRRR